jgi:8-amino-7-oxononanoate synthase
LDVLEREPQRVDRLRANADYLRTRLKDAGWNTGESTTAIVPILVQDQDTAVRLWTQLAASGIEAQLITGRRRVTPRIRLIVRSGHSQEDLDRCLDALNRVGHDIGVG